MAAAEDLEPRVLALEARVRATEVDIAAGNEKLSGIVGGQDVILGVLRDHGHLLAAHGDRLDGIDAKLAQHDVRFDRIDARFDEHDARFDEHDARFAEHDARFDRIDGKLDLIVDWIQAHP